LIDIPVNPSSLHNIQPRQLALMGPDYVKKMAHKSFLEVQRVSGYLL